MRCASTPESASRLEGKAGLPIICVTEKQTSGVKTNVTIQSRQGRETLEHFDSPSLDGRE
jgi:hypothetical protein